MHGAAALAVYTVPHVQLKLPGSHSVYEPHGHRVPVDRVYDHDPPRVRALIAARGLDSTVHHARTVNALDPQNPRTRTNLGMR